MVSTRVRGQSTLGQRVQLSRPRTLSRHIEPQRAWADPACSTRPKRRTVSLRAAPSLRRHRGFAQRVHIVGQVVEVTVPNRRALSAGPEKASRCPRASVAAISDSGNGNVKWVSGRECGGRERSSEALGRLIAPCVCVGAADILERVGRLLEAWGLGAGHASGARPHGIIPWHAVCARTKAAVWTNT